MAKNTPLSTAFLQWTKHIPAMDVQDPLGMNLRVSARLGGQLLHCITSVTPRARYYSFIPWCVYDYQRREKGKPQDRGLREAIRRRENALAVGCVFSHDGKACERGGVVGSDKVVEDYATMKKKDIDLAELHLVDAPAFGIYYGSLVNLGVFKTTEELEEEEDSDESSAPSSDNLELSPLGLQLAHNYDSQVGTLSAVASIASPKPVTSGRALSEIGKRGGLCELASPTAEDRNLLRAMFFNTDQSRKKSHPFRRSTLLLLLELVRQLEEHRRQLTVGVFANAVYYGTCQWDDGALQEFSWPAALVGFVPRWRMFYSHYYLSVALESLLVCVVSALGQAGLGGIPLVDMAERIIGPTASSDIAHLLDADLAGAFMDATPQSVLAALGSYASAASLVDSVVDVQSPIAEWTLERHLRKSNIVPGGSGAALSLTLLSLVMGRYVRWRDTDYGKWFANCAKDPYLDTCPPVVLNELERHFPDWFTTPWKTLAPFVVSRFVIRQHEALAYEKSRGGTKALLQVDGDRVREQGQYGAIGVGNPRFNNALRILKDLGLLADDNDAKLTVLTAEGRQFVEEELKREMAS